MTAIEIIDDHQAARDIGLIAFPVREKLTHHDKASAFGEARTNDSR
jgi:hypothetical protein